ncbi:DUF1194 domain-containing protein, partial [Azospirillum brasilense]|nr:DUF1194 domain-containing protein [Azospirillum brasilense]
WTSISAAIDFSARLFNDNGFEGTRRVIDGSGAGGHNRGRPVQWARHGAVAARVRPNGPPGPDDPRHPRGGGTPVWDPGGGGKRARRRLGKAPVMGDNADILWLDGPSPTLARLARHWNPDEMDALLLLMATTKAVGYEGRGDYHMDPLGRLTRRGEMEIAPFVYAGVQIVKPELFGQDTPDGAFSTNRVWDRAQEAGRLFGLAHAGLWFHIGPPAPLAETEEMLSMSDVSVVTT